MTTRSRRCPTCRRSKRSSSPRQTRWPITPAPRDWRSHRSSESRPPLPTPSPTRSALKSPRSRLRLGGFWLRSEQRRGPPDSLNHVRADERGKVVGGLLRGDVGVLGELDLHQLTIGKRVLLGLLQRIRDALVADVYRDAQMMRLRAEVRALPGCDRHFSACVVA